MAQILSDQKVEEIKALIQQLEERDTQLERLSKKIAYLKARNNERKEAYSKILYHVKMAQEEDRRAIEDARSGEPEVPQYS